MPNFPSPFLLRLEENPQLRKKAMVKLGSELNDKRPASHMNRAKVLDARWPGEVSVSTISLKSRYRYLPRRLVKWRLDLARTRVRP